MCRSLLFLKERPGVRKSQRAGELWAVHNRGAAAADQIGAHDPRGRAALGDDDVAELPLQAQAVESRAHPAERVLPLPVLVGRAGLCLVGIVDASQVRDGRLPESEGGELVVLRLAARGGEEEGLRDLALVEDDLQVGAAYGLVGLRGLRADAAVGLASGVVEDVELAAVGSGGEDV